MAELTFECIPSPPLDTNMFLVADTEARKAIAIDPSEAATKLLEKSRENDWTIEAIVLTHGHIDHTAGAAALAQASGAPVWGHALVEEALRDPVRSGAAFVGMEQTPCPLDRKLQDGDKISVGALELSILHTPGHAPDAICLIGEADAFVGDLLFRGGVGRYDFPDSDLSSLINSLRRLSDRLGDEVRIHPGHGPSSTMARERRENPYLLEWLK
ncbi:MAG: MBL fold metallo-hydrolase [Candidatus Sumerlaeota bacterium]